MHLRCPAGGPTAPGWWSQLSAPSGWRPPPAMRRGLCHTEARFRVLQRRYLSATVVSAKEFLLS
jgi:hypothetical protein